MGSTPPVGPLPIGSTPPGVSTAPPATPSGLPAALPGPTGPLLPPVVIDPYNVAPLCGGQSNAIAFTGGAPVLDTSGNFTSTSTASTGPPSYSALRTSRVRT
jgi:hypothetical protein